MILVTGADGFVGRGVLAYFQETGVPFVAATRCGGPIQNGIESVPTGEINEATDWTAHLVGVTAIVHLAGVAHIKPSLVSQQRMVLHRTNVLATERLARQAALMGVKRFIYLSSAKVNGESSFSGRPFNVGDRPSPGDEYARSKFDAERTLRSVEQTTDLQVVIIRAPLVYGPGVKANFASLLRWANSGLPLPFAGLIGNRRSFVAVRNLSDLIATCVEHPHAGGHLFFVSDGYDLSTRELLEGVSDAMGQPTKLFSMPLNVLKIIALLLGKTGTLQRLTESFQVDIAHTRDTLGWSPKVTFEQAIQEVASRL